MTAIVDQFTSDSASGMAQSPVISPMNAGYGNNNYSFREKSMTLGAIGSQVDDLSIGAIPDSALRASLASQKSRDLNKDIENVHEALK